ncbi:MAG: nitrilase-related carbon-nitrogen hydrolase [Qingshengfaniella sp.]
MIPPRDVTLAAAAYPIEPLSDPAAVARKLADWVDRATGADILVFPEYAGIEAALSTGHDGDAASWCTKAADHAGWYRDRLCELARLAGVYILAGSTPAWHAGHLVNRAWFISPQGQALWQDKQVLTPWERQNTPLHPADHSCSFETDFGKIGVLICYDSEFPLLARRQDCAIHLVPSCTDSAAGDHRVATGCRARALENQAVTVHAPLLGAAAHCPLVDENHGRAGIYAPCDTGWPEDGVLALGGRDQPGWTRVTLAAGRISAARASAAVTIPAQWPETEQAVPHALSWL